MSYRNTKIELLDHTIGQKEFLTLGEFMDANRADEELRIEAFAMVPSLKPGESWSFGAGSGETYEIRKALP